MPDVDPVISFTLRGVLALVFAEAVFHKVTDFMVFRETLANYELLPERLVAPIAGFVIAIELGLIPALLIPGTGAWAALVAAAVLALYALAITANLIRGRRYIDCGCTGPSLRQPLSGGLVVRNLVLVGGALVAAQGPAVRDLGLVDAATVVFAVLGGYLIYAAANALLATAARYRELWESYD